MNVLDIRSIKDFQLIFNQMSETCFKTCVSTFISRSITTEEGQCVENCSGKHINANHKLMQIFMEVQPVINRKHKEEFQKAQETLETTQQEHNPEQTI